MVATSSQEGPLSWPVPRQAEVELAGQDWARIMPAGAQCPAGMRLASPQPSRETVQCISREMMHLKWVIILGNNSSHPWNRLGRPAEYTSSLVIVKVTGQTVSVLSFYFHDVKTFNHLSVPFLIGTIAKPQISPSPPLMQHSCWNLFHSGLPMLARSLHSRVRGSEMRTS